MSPDGRAGLFEANLAVLERRYPDLAALVAAAEPWPLELSMALSGEMSARAPSGAWLHSSRDPRAEARRIAQASLPGGDVVVMLGLGLGYLAEALLDAGAERLILCEAEVGALSAALRVRALGPLLADERLGFVVGGEPEGIISALEISGMRTASLVELKAAVASSPEWYERARGGVERWMAKGEVNENTLRRFGKLWVRNLAANYATAASSLGVGCLEGLFSGLPALVLAAGPSLDSVLPRIRELSRRALVVAVDTSLRSLLRYGVEPDFLVVVDPQYWNWRHLAGLRSPSAFLVSEMAAWPAVFRMERRGTFLGGSLFPLGRRMEAFAGTKGMLGAGGSVATSAWDLCRIVGCSPIWMAGLDLSYPEGQTHARASLFEQRALGSGCRLSPASSVQAGALVGGTSLEALDASGGRVRTDQRMRLYAWWFESRFARPSSPPTFSFSPGGLAIPGLGLIGLDEALAFPERRDEIDAILEGVASMRPPLGSQDATAAGLAELRAQLSSIIRMADEAGEQAREGRRAFTEGGDCGPMLAALEAADAALLGIEARDVASFLLPSLSALIGRKPRDLGESFAQSEHLYRSLAESARYNLGALESAHLNA